MGLPVCPSDYQADEWYTRSDNTGLVDVWNLPELGSRSKVIIAVLDTGLDLANGDLVNNIFINEGELPPAFTKKDAAGNKAADFDGDGVITFHDFNPEDPMQLSAARAFLAAQNVRDLNANGLFDPTDFLDERNPIVNHVDDDHDILGLKDDIVGWDFSPITDKLGDATGLPGNNMPLDDNGHGTKVASVAAAVGNNNLGIVGALWNARILPIKTHAANGTGQGLLPIVTGLKYAQSLGAAVANYSASSNLARKNSDVSQCASNVHVTMTSSNGAFDNFVQQTVSQWDMFGITIPVVATVEDCALDWDSGNFFAIPAMIKRPNVISVTATDRLDAIAPAVGTGANSLDIGAPGVDIWVLNPGSTDPHKFMASGGVGATSLAAPLVSGTIGLMVDRNPSLLGNGKQIRDTIIATGTNKAGNPKTSIATTGGRLNALAAVTAH
jgi:subtilisin family serine protease